MSKLEKRIKDGNYLKLRYVEYKIDGKNSMTFDLFVYIFVERPCPWSLETSVQLLSHHLILILLLRPRKGRANGILQELYLLSYYDIILSYYIIIFWALTGLEFHSFLLTTTQAYSRSHFCMIYPPDMYWLIDWLNLCAPCLIQRHCLGLNPSPQLRKQNVVLTCSLNTIFVMDKNKDRSSMMSLTVWRGIKFCTILIGSLGAVATTSPLQSWPIVSR